MSTLRHTINSNDARPCGGYAVSSLRLCVSKRTIDFTPSCTRTVCVPLTVSPSRRSASTPRSDHWPYTPTRAAAIAFGLTSVPRMRAPFSPSARRATMPSVYASSPVEQPALHNHTGLVKVASSGSSVPSMRFHNCVSRNKNVSPTVSAGATAIHSARAAWPPSSSMRKFIVRVHQQGDHPGLGNHFGQQFEPLDHQLGCHDAEAREVAARPGETGDKAQYERVADASEEDRDRCGCAFRRQWRTGAAACHDQIDLTGDEIGGQGGQPIIMALRPAIFDRHALSLDIADFAEPLAERGQKRCSHAGRTDAEVA